MFCAKIIEKKNYPFPWYKYLKVLKFIVYMDQLKGEHTILDVNFLFDNDKRGGNSFVQRQLKKESSSPLV